MANRYLFPALILVFLFSASLVFIWSAKADHGEPEAATGERNQTEIPLDPVVGSWQCSNGVYNWTIFFQANGNLIQQEPTFGNTRNTSWARLSDQEIILGGGQVLSVSMDGDSQMSVIDQRVGSTWECSRQ